MSLSRRSLLTSTVGAATAAVVASAALPSLASAAQPAQHIEPGGQLDAATTWGSPRGGGEIHTLIHQAREKIDRIRGQMSFLPDVAAPAIKHIATVDPWSRGLGIAALVLFVLMLAAFAGFWFVLSSGASQIS